MARNYVKGARSERELANMLVERGFLVVRAAGSGVYKTAPDLLAFKGHEQYAFECKAWKGDRLSLRKEQYGLLREWEEKSGLSVYIAWKVPYDGWLFVRPSELNEHMSIRIDHARRIGRRIEGLV
ncbi:MAG: Holliday junction resolvase Hjc [Candidatus Micrarchaeia archaeon]